MLRQLVDCAGQGKDRRRVPAKCVSRPSKVARAFRLRALAPRCIYRHMCATAQLETQGSEGSYGSVYEFEFSPVVLVILEGHIPEHVVPFLRPRKEDT